MIIELVEEQVFPAFNNLIEKMWVSKTKDWSFGLSSEANFYRYSAINYEIPFSMSWGEIEPISEKMMIEKVISAFTSLHPTAAYDRNIFSHG